MAEDPGASLLSSLWCAICCVGNKADDTSISEVVIDETGYGTIEDDKFSSEEIEEEIRDSFMEAGGETFSYIPCLNDRDDHIDALLRVINNELAGWLSVA